MVSKIVKGIYLIVVGGLITAFPPVSYINLEALFELGNYFNITNYGNYITHGSQGSETTVFYETSIAFMIIGVLTVLYGIYTLWEAKNEKSQSNN